MPDYSIAAKNKDIDNIQNGVSVKTLTEQRMTQGPSGEVKTKFREYSEHLKDNGDESKSLYTNKDTKSESGEKSKYKGYNYFNDGDGKKLQVTVKSENQDRTRIIEGDKAERKFNRVLNRQK
jgi:hypothetical protein